jgi:hypothetical protein
MIQRGISNHRPIGQAAASAPWQEASRMPHGKGATPSPARADRFRNAARSHYTGPIGIPATHVSRQMQT